MEIKTKVNARDEKGNPVVLGQGNGTRFRLLEPGYYVAVVRKHETETYDAKSGVKYVKVRPVFEIVKNDEGADIDPCEISRQDFVIGALNENGELYRPDGDETKSALWGGTGGAQYLLLSEGLLRQTAPGLYEIAVDLDKVKDRVVRVKVDTGEFERKNAPAGQEAGKKNVITQIRPLAEVTDDDPAALSNRAEELGFYCEDGQVYLNELVFNAQTNLLSGGEEDNNF